MKIAKEAVSPGCLRHSLFIVFLPGKTVIRFLLLATQAKDGAAALPFGAFFVTLSPQRPDRPEGGEATKQTTIKTRTHT
ncbi:MAG: hypothetical protein SOW10_03305 [Alloprevotella sp.]|nr:hypothetical protein [Alloprevotella sp.]